jgi:8-oxo-dGTP diphosphatase
MGRSAFTRRLLVRAAGGLLWRAGPRGPELAVIHRPRHRDWTLPKGKLELGESFRDAALREVAEETGCGARLLRFAGFTFYLAAGRPKLVAFWHMRADACSPFEPSEEVDRLEWLTPPEAGARLDHAGERRMLARARRSMPPLAR